MLNLNIIPACREDAENILALQKQAYQQEAQIYQDWSIPPLTQSLPEIEAEFTSHTFLKAELAGALVGSVRAILTDGTCLIGRLIVHPDFQRQGIGSRLLHAIEEKFLNADRYELFTGARSEDNIGLYTKLGYHIFQTKFVSTNLTLVFLEKLKGIPKS